ncbi:MAG: hypothetical protein DLD55_01210 [candidate division SR1 bacterium]|nr:MAG: hypothetical protein DLD55_01210 [candidate division SR1 bacterium]
MQKTKTTAEIKKFGYEVGDGYTAVVSLDEKLKGLALIYQLSIHPPREEDQLIKDESYQKFSFRAFTLRSLDFREIKFKIDGDAMKKLIDLKALGVEKVGITLTVIE